jgi:hypothetical protein
MKIIQKNTLTRTAAQDKENLPANALQKLRGRADGKKIGQDIKHKIHKISHHDDVGVLAERNANCLLDF